MNKNPSNKTRIKMSKAQKERFKNLENHPMFMKKRLKETKNKISESLKGRIPWNKGLTKETDERVKKYGKKNKGSKRTEKSRKKMSNTRKGKSIGELNPNWKGGISCEPYCDVWIDKEYKKSIKERDNYTCQNPFCLCDNSNLVIHHINYKKKECKPNNLITLCNSSNVRANKDRWFWQEIYKRIIK